MSSNPYWVELGVHGTSVLSHTWTKNKCFIVNNIFCHQHVLQSTEPLEVLHSLEIHDSMIETLD